MVERGKRCKVSPSPPTLSLSHSLSLSQSSVKEPGGRAPLLGTLKDKQKGTLEMGRLCLKRLTAEGLDGGVLGGTWTDALF
jgi:hypothetical protein